MGGGPYYAYQGGSRILDANRVDQSGADNANVTDWTKTDDFILAVNIHSNAKDTEAAQYKLRWKVAGGSFADVGAATTIHYNATTDLVNGANIAVGGRKCDSQGGDTWQAGEEVEGASLCDSIDLVDEYETEIHFALDCSGAADNTEYEFELWDATLDVTRGTCGATLKIKPLYYAVQGGSRILNASKVDQSGADNANVIDWVKTSDFILAVNINSGGNDTEAAQYKLRWKQAGGTFADVGAATTIHYNATTDLVNGANIAVGGRKCDSQGGDTWQAGEEVEGASLCDSIDLVDEYETEIHFALDCSGANSDVEYIFELYDATLGVTRGTCGATIKIEVIPYDFVEIDVFEHDTNNYENSLVKIDSTHFMLAYAGDAFNGDIKTFSIDANYENIAQVHALEHDASDGRDNSLVMIDSTHFILAYAGFENDGYIKTFSIDGSYVISEIDSVEHDAANGIENSLIMLDSTHFVLAYQTSGLNGNVTTFSIDGSYNITEIDTLVVGSLVQCSLLKIDSTHFVLALSGEGFDGYVKSFSVNGSYVISQIHSLEHDILYGGCNSLGLIDSTHFFLAYRGDQNDGYVKVFTLDGSYNISQTSSLEHDTSTIADMFNSVAVIDTTHMALAYAAESSYGRIKVFSIDGAYAITEESNMMFDSTQGKYNSLVKIDSTHFILAYQGADCDGFLKTFRMEPAAAVGTRPSRVFLGPFGGPFGGPV